MLDSFAGGVRPSLHYRDPVARVAIAGSVGARALRPAIALSEALEACGFGPGWPADPSASQAVELALGELGYSPAGRSAPGMWRLDLSEPPA